MSDATPKPVFCSIDEAALMCRPEFSDRFIYSDYFIPLDLRYDDNETPILTHYQKRIVETYYSFDPGAVASVLPELKLPKLLEANEIDLRGGSTPIDPTELSSVSTPDRVVRLADDARANVESVRIAIDLVRGTDANLASLLEERVNRIDTVVNTIANSAAELRSTDVGVGTAEEASLGGGQHIVLRRDGTSPMSTLPLDQRIELLLQLLRSEVGYVFFDRTRIRPAGFAIGEHVYTLSLAPGEEVVLEQKAYSKRQETFEEQTEQEKQMDLELSSTLSTELQEGFERQKSLSTTTGLSAGGSLGINIKQVVNISGHLDYSKNVTEANSTTERRSVKESSTASQKVASKYRTAHKVDFKVSSERGFEQTSKRTIRNPNRYTPLSLEYFKILRVLDLIQERFGVRLCWAPCVKDPAFDVFERIRKGREEILRRAEDAVQKPSPPKPPVKANKPPKSASSGQVEANNWGLFDDMSADYEVAIAAPADYVWDGNASTIQISVTAQNVDRQWGWNVVGQPWADGTGVKVKVHVGVDWHLGGKRGTIYITASANFIADPSAPDPDYKAAYDKYVADLAKWQQTVDDLLADARAKGAEQAAEWEQALIRQFNPVGELMNRVIHSYFPPTSRDECWELELWQDIFDWDEATYISYPGWWNDGPLRDYTKDPADFVNASFAKLYVPIKIGFEEMALRWIFAKQVERPLDAKKEAAFKKIIDDLAAFRKDKFGDERETDITPGTRSGDPATYVEKFITIAHWDELVPTDGTHVEVVQTLTSAEDSFSAAEVDETNKLKAALIASHEQDVEIKKKALAEMSSVNVDLKIGTDAGSNGA